MGRKRNSVGRHSKEKGAYHPLNISLLFTQPFNSCNDIKSLDFTLARGFSSRTKLSSQRAPPEVPQFIVDREAFKSIKIYNFYSTKINILDHPTPPLFSNHPQLLLPSSFEHLQGTDLSPHAREVGILILKDFFERAQIYTPRSSFFSLHLEP